MKKAANNVRKYYGRAIIYILLYWSLGALALTGQVSLGLLCLFAGLVAYTLYPNSILTKLPPLLWTFFTVMFFISALYLAGRDFFLALLILFFYLILNKICNPMQPRDEIQTLGLCFFLCLSSLAITDSLIVSVFILGYLFLFTLAMLLITARAEQDEAARQARMHFSFTKPLPLSPPVGHRNQDLRLMIKIGGKILLALLPMGAFFFVLVPRFNVPRFSANFNIKRREERVTGYSENIDLGSMAGIKKDSRVAMRVQTIDYHGNQLRLPGIYMRGSSLDFYDGRRWSRSWGASRLTEYIRAPRSVYFPYVPNIEGVRVFQRIFVEPAATPFVFALNYPWTFSFSQHHDMVMDNEGNAIRLIQPSDDKLSYTAVSIIETPDSRKKLITGTNNSPAPNSGDSNYSKRLAKYLQEPRGGWDLRLKKMSEDLTRAENTPYEKAVKIENYLRTVYQYSLDFVEKGEENPLSEFLFDRKTGHCEFFATAMVALCRAAGVPARIVNGFYSDEWNAFGSYYIVRMQDAHSWVEVWFEDAGWLSFEPTPPGGRARDSSGSWIPTGAQRMYDTMKFHWYQYVIDFNLRDQMRMSRHFNTLARFIGFTMANANNGLQRLFHGESSNFTMPSWGKSIFVIIGFLAMASIGGYYFKRRRKRKKDLEIAEVLRRYKGSPHAVEYERFLKILKERGIARLPFQTPLEFAHIAVSQGDAPAEFLPLTSRYYELRYRHDSKTTGDDELFQSFFKKLESWISSRLKDANSPEYPQNNI